MPWIKRRIQARRAEPQNKKTIMERLTERLVGKYPDLKLIQDIYQDMVAKHKSSDPGALGDEKYRPLPLLIALLYKIQARNDDFFQYGGDIIENDDESYLHLLGHFWHLLHNLGKQIRDKVNVTSLEDLPALLERNKINAAKACDLQVEDIAVVWLSELGSLGLPNHCPDYVLSVDSGQQCVVFTLLGTRIFPRPSPHDIIMDLAGSTTQFYDTGGEGHTGMVHGTQNLLEAALPEIAKLLDERPGYSLLVIGYSLGAGLAQLITAALELPMYRSQLPVDMKIRAIAYGCPPVYRGSEGQPEPDFLLPNLLVVQNHNDGISGASLRGINNVFLKTRAIENLKLKRRTLIQMSFSSVAKLESPTEEGNSDNDDNISIKDEELSSIESILMEDDDEDPEADLGEEGDQGKESEESASGGGLFSSIRNQFSKMMRCPSENKWKMVEEAVESIPDARQPRLYQLTNNILVLKLTKEKRMISRKFTGADTFRFSEQIRFKTTMFDDHMPWGYNHLFAGYGTDKATMEAVNLECLDVIMQGTTGEGNSPDQIQDGARGFRNQLIASSGGNLYPNLSGLSEDA